jgi:nitroreductase
LAEYSSRFGQDQITAIGFDTLAAYIRFHQQHGIQLESLEASISKIAACNQNNKVCSKGMGGAYEITRARIYSDGKIDIVPFLNSRHSIRHFDSHRVDQELIRQAVSMAITTPSVCNRQAWKARVFHDDSAKNAILAIQNGNRGFTELIDTVLIVTCDLDCFMSVAERNQPWIDGGMFSMTLLLALHSVGLGACCLNWCVEKDRDMQLRKLIRLPESEVVIMIIAVGHIPEKLMVARSARKPLEEVLFFEG